MPRFVALLRGVSPLNCTMPDLARAFGALGFTDVKTVLASGNVVFSSTSRSEATIARTIAGGLESKLGRPFDTFVRSVDDLRALLDDDPFARVKIPAESKRVVTFFQTAPKRVALPIVLEEARILALRGREAFTSYVPTPGNPVFMRLIAKTFGDENTTRTWDTLLKLVRDRAR